MAKASWAVVSPASGSGNKTVNVSSNAPHTGRSARQTTLTISAANVESKYVTVNQAGKPEYVENDSDTATSIKGGQTVTISGKSNSSKLTFSLGTGNLNLTLPAKYTASGLQINNGAAITGDPGASAEYDWSIQFTVAANTGVAELTRQIIVTDDGGHTDTCLLTQASGDATLTVSKTSVDIDWEGNATSFNITSNTSWSIS